MKKYKVVIVGGGASGLACAVELTRGKNALLGSDVLILERNDRLAKKLTVTGNGQGNITNASLLACNFYGEKKFIDSFIEQTKKYDVRKYFYGLGLATTVDKVGRVYPMSKQASAVSDVLRAHLSNKGVEVKLSSEVLEVNNTGDEFIISTSNGKYYSEKIVFAFGGSVAKQFGTDGSAYKLLLNFGHSVTKLYPSLVQIKTNLTKIRGLKGLKENAKITAFDGEKEIASANGEILFTEYGISGNAVFSISGHLMKAKNPWVRVSFLPEVDDEMLVEILKNSNKNSPLYNENAFAGIINKMIGKAVIKNAESNSVYSLAYSAKNFDLSVTGSLGFNFAQVTKGGINTKDIDPNTYQSKLVSDAYVIGEALDVDGDCGGYNLTFAWISGIVSANVIKDQLK